MKIRSAIAVLALVTSGSSVAEEYQSFTNLEYTKIDVNSIDADIWLIGTSYFLDNRIALGPLNEFVYINPISNFGAAYARIEDEDRLLINGEYFFGNVVVGAAASDEDGIDKAWVGYLFSENFIARLEAVDELDIFDGDDDTELYVSAGYQMKFQGVDYLGFSARTDVEFDNVSVSAKYFKGLSNGDYLSFDASLADRGPDSLGASYYWGERTSARVSILGDDGFGFGARYFFDRNFSVDIDYEDLDFGDVIHLRLRAQF